MKAGLLVALIAGIAPPSAPREAVRQISADVLRAHVRFLASDLLEGRGTPSRGLDIAAEYIAALRRNGYNGVISIEHEDSAVEREEGFLIGKKYLEHFMAY